jgi:hypothetical protein
MNVKRDAKAVTSGLMMLGGLLLIAGCVGPGVANQPSIPSGTPVGVALVLDGVPQAVIVAPADRKPLQRNGVDGVEELVEHIRLISGATLLVVTNAADLPKGLVPIRLGEMTDADLDGTIRARGDLPSAFALRVAADRIDIRGLGGEGTLFGIYELLEQLGVRWYAPGDWGRVVPEARTLRLAVQLTVQSPSLKIRSLGGWMAPNTGWWIRQRQGRDIERATGRHGMPGNPPKGTGGQTCLSGGHAPGALEAVVAGIRQELENNPGRREISLGPHDGGGYCQCDGCRALDGDSWDPLRKAPAMTDRYIGFFNRVLEALDKDYPDLRLAWYVYAAHFFPPKHVVPNPRIIHTFAPIDLDRNRGMDNPMGTDRHIFKHIIEGWSAFKPAAMNYRGYYNNLACPQFPWSQIDRVRHEIPALQALGFDAFTVEVIRQSWASSVITPYVAARVMWNVETDVDALLAEFYKLFYGPAEDPMRAYLEGLESAFRDTPYRTGGSAVYFPIFDVARRDTLRGHLDRAARRAPRGRTGLYGERVWAARQGFDRLEIFLDMIAARNRHDYAAARAKMEAYWTLTDALADTVLEGGNLKWPGMRSRLALINFMERSDRHKDYGRDNYFKRFWEPAIVSGHLRTVEAGQFVKGLEDEWDFLLDPAEIGEIGGWHRPGPLGGNWQRLKTTSRSWSDQGFHDYKGVAWYRQHVVIPKTFEGRPVYLWFGGVGVTAKVWVNGELLGTSSEPNAGLPGAPGTFKPFDLLATDAIRFGKSNTVSVKITNDRLAELGVGGIISPVMFWTPKDPAWRP